MPQPDAPPLTRAVVVRGIGFALAIALGAVAVWLIVTGSTSPRRIEIGVLAGLWGLLLGAYTMFGARRHVETTVLAASTEVERRTAGGLEPAAQAEARRAFEERLEHLLRTEISNSVNREVGDLRREVTQLRHELLEKVGGQLRLERIETTRLIGSDLEALQHEVRELKTARDAVVARPAAPRIDPVGAARAIEAQAAAERKRAEEARQKVAAAERERVAREAAERERVTRETAEREQAARRKAAEERAAREKAAAAERARVEREKAERDRAARESSEREQAARERAAREQAARDTAAREQAARDKAARDRAARERAAREQAERERAAEEKAERERVAREKAAAELAAREQAEREKAAHQKAERERPAREKAMADQIPTSVANGTSKDPFASLPRITPFTDFELDPVDPVNTVNGVETANGNGHHIAPDDDGPTYTGRRRAAGADDATRHSRHAAPDETSPDPDPSDDADGGRRRRRRHADGDDGIDLLSQLLSRESAER